MNTNLHKNWKVVGINGIIAILFGALILYDSETVLLGISLYFGLIALIGGVVLLIGAYDQRKKGGSHQMLFLAGLIMSIIGILIMVFPLQTLRIFLLLIGVWALLLGLLEIYIAIAMGKRLSYSNVMIIGGALLSAVGMLLLTSPSWTAANMMNIIGVLFAVLGVMMVYFSFGLWSAK